MGTIASVVGSVAVSAYSIYSGSRASERATDIYGRMSGRTAKLQREMQERAIEHEKEMLEQARADVAPWREAGQRALGTLEEMMATGPGKFEADPGYQFRLGEGLKAIERSAAARGGLLSGRTGYALQRYGQDLASQEYGNFLARYYQRMAPYQAMAGYGQQAAAQMAAGTQQAAGNIGQYYMGGGQAISNALMQSGQAQAANVINQANIRQAGLGQIASNLMLYGMGAFSNP